MLKLIHITEIKKAVQEEYEVWAITRDPIPVINENVFLKPNLAPSKSLMGMVKSLAQESRWSNKLYDDFFVPSFIKEMFTKEYKHELNELYLACKDRNIALACSGRNEEHSVRAIVGGLIQALNIDYEGNNYSIYWLIHRQMAVGTYRGKIPQIKNQNKLF